MSEWAEGWVWFEHTFIVHVQYSSYHAVAIATMFPPQVKAGPPMDNDSVLWRSVSGAAANIMGPHYWIRQSGSVAM